MEGILELAKKVNGILWSIGLDYHDTYYDDIHKARSASDKLVREIKEEINRRKE